MLTGIAREQGMGLDAIELWFQDEARSLDPSAWQRMSAGEGSKSARLHDWAYWELADLNDAEYDEA